MRFKKFASGFLLSLFILNQINAQEPQTSVYDDCIALANVDPNLAIGRANRPDLAGTQSGWHCQGVALYQLGRFEEAGDIFAELSDALANQASEATPNIELIVQTAEAYSNALQSNDQQVFDKALKWTRRWSDVEPQNIESWFLQAELLSSNGAAASALIPALQAQSLAKFEQRPRALAVTAGIRIKTGDLVNAQDDLYTALEINPNDETSLYVLGHWYWAQGDTKNAKEVWQKLKNVSREKQWRDLAEQELSRP
ncbi:MAG: tetratricopeptide repeat protein [Alphaproteobacteria bacterium]